MKAPTSSDIRTRRTLSSCTAKGVVKHHPLETPGGIQQVRFITEPDLYRLITHSKLPEAEKFERWVFDEVLPSIRKHGMYATPATIETAEGDPTPSAFGKILSNTIPAMGPNKFCRWLLVTPAGQAYFAGILSA